MNLVEIATEESSAAPCEHGNIVNGHACYCHAQNAAAPRKCPIWRNFGEDDTKWHANGDFNSEDWDGGCVWFVPAPWFKPANAEVKGD